MAVIAPILWDRYKSKAALEIQLVSSTSLFNTTTRLDKLQVLYGSQPIRDLTSTAFTVRNTGRTPLRSSDLVTPPTITLPDSIQLLEVRQELSDPPDLAYVVHSDTGARSVTLVFSLLNPTDVIRLAVITAGPVRTFQAGGRIAGVSRLSLVNRVERPSREGQGSLTPAGLMVLVALTCLFLLGPAVYSLGQQVSLRALTEAGLIALPSEGTVATYQRYIGVLKTQGKNREQLKPILDLLAALPGERALTADEHSSVHQGLRQVLSQDRTVRRTVMALVAITITGIGYVLLNS